MNPRHPLIALALLLAALCASGQGTLVYDQQSSDSDTNVSLEGYYVNSHQPFGQSFTPTLSSVGFVKLLLFQRVSFEQYASIYVNLRSNSISGPIIGQTETLTFSGRDFPGHSYVNFVFPTAIPVTPEQTYYFQVVMVAGDWPINLFGDYRYDRGTAIISGLSSHPAVDLVFREGIVVPEPSAAILLPLGGGALLWARRRHPRPSCS